ncbi:uncharacterized protein LOC122309164 [Carya illinoinensis]|uniref:DUF1262 family protein n=1 Tax=Carya illinoinensis TaxID=32201 RepID=A0A8T1QHI0_CARIL|nr:uncharacterized protein LOC122309164 [Carya illinoinensis]KAG6654036.1 hypothetical protein CIPAW_05G118100 [Carya illinoinensis]
MYVTKFLSDYQKDPSSLFLPPPEGPNSGVLVIQDEEAEPTCCFGLSKSHTITDQPFPQNKKLTLRYSTGVGDNNRVERFYVALIPVLNQPLSSNRYYAIKTHGRHTGEAYANSKEDDMGTCCCFDYVNDVPPRPLDPNEMHQQFEIHPNKTLWGRSGFVAKPIAPDGFLPRFLANRGWEVHTSTPRNFSLGEAPGLDTTLRARLPDFSFPLSCKSSQNVVVGRWYSPFMFIKEGTPKDQMTRSMYYKITLEQKWEQLFSCEKSESQSNAVVVDAVVQREEVLIAGMKVVDLNVVDEVMWFKSFGNGGGEVRVGLSMLVVERMKWEQIRVGWVGGNERQVALKRVEEFGGSAGEWMKFGLYVLVERFVVKRMDGSLVLTYDFKHINQTRAKWE